MSLTVGILLSIGCIGVFLIVVSYCWRLISGMQYKIDDVYDREELPEMGDSEEDNQR